MKFESKALITFTTTLIIGFSIINFLGITYLRFILEERIEKEVDCISKFYTIYPNFPLPKYLFISKDPIPPYNYEVVRYTGKYFVFVRKNYLQDKLRKFAFSLFIWEGAFIVALTFIFYRVIIKYLKKEEVIKNTLNILLLTLTHRIGNFLAVQKVNIELIDKSKPAKRLKENLDRLKREYEKTLKILEDIQKRYEIEENYVNLKEVALRALKSIRIRNDINIKLNLKDTKIKTNPVYIDVLITSLIENAIKYAETTIHVKICNRIHKKPLLIIRNDINNQAYGGGTGIGLQIVKFVSEKLGVTVKYRVRKHFTVIVRF